MSSYRKTMREAREEMLVISEAKYDLYHKDFSTAMQHAYKMAKKLHGITVDPKEIDDKVASGPRKPSEGKTNSYRLEGDKGSIQVQVYNKGGPKPFELNFYKEEFELDEDMAKTADLLQKMIKPGDPDRYDFVGVRDHIEANNMRSVKNIVMKMDTEPRERVIAALEKGLGKKETEKILGVKIRPAREEVELDEKMSSAQISQLKKAFEPMRGKKISMKHGEKLRGILDKVGDDKEVLLSLLKANIPFVSRGAATRLISKHDMKGAEINKLMASYNVEEADLDEAEDFKPHKMYDPETGEAHDAKTMEDHLRMKKMGYSHDKPEVKESGQIKEVPFVAAIPALVGAARLAAPYIARAFGGTAKAIAKNPGKAALATAAAANPELTKKVVGGAVDAAKTVAKNTDTLAKAAKIGAGAAAVGAGAVGAKKAYDAVKKKVKKEDTQFDEIAVIPALATGALGAIGAYGMNKMLGNPNNKKEKEEKTESAASDARRAMAADPSTKQKFSKNVSATDDDIKSADKNIMMQMRKAVSLRGNKVEFMDKKKVDIPQKVAQAVLDKYNSQKKPADKEKFQAKVSKSYKSMLTALKEQNEINNKNNSLHELKSLVREMKGKNNG